MKYFFSAIVLLLSPVYVIAQSNYHKGAVVTKNGQTLTGYINYREWEENPKLIEFKNSTDDKTAQSLYPAGVKTFVIDGFEKYYTYTGSISLNKTRFPDLAEGHDTSSLYGSFFFKMVTSGERLTLYTFTDSLKTRCFIQEQNEQPFELIYHEYYVNSKDSIHTDTRYLGQLTYLIKKYEPSNTQLLSRLNKLSYTDIDGIEAVVKAINGDNNKSTAKHQIANIRFFTGVAINMNKPGFYGDNYFSSAAKQRSFTPKISAGIDIFNNPNVQKFFFRADVSFSYFNTDIGSATNSYAYQQVYSISQYSLTLTPQLILNVYNKDALKIYIDGGLGIIFSNYPTNKVTVPALNNTEISTKYGLENAWINFPIQVGVVINKKLEFFASRAGSQSFTKYVDFAIENEIYSAGIHYLFSNAAK